MSKRGAADDSNVVGVTQQQRSDDLAELAARLGAVGSFSRSGEVVHSWDFENGLGPWGSPSEDEEGVQGIDDTWTRSGSGAAYLEAAAKAGNLRFLHYEAPKMLTSNVGFEVQLSIGVETVRNEVWISAYTGTRLYRFKANVEANGFGVLEYYAGGTWHELAEPGLVGPSGPCFENLKLIVDVDAGEYVSLSLNGVEYDLGGVTADWETVISRASIEFYVLVYATPDLVAYAWVDDVVITQGE